MLGSGFPRRHPVFRLRAHRGGSLAVVLTTGTGGGKKGAVIILAFLGSLLEKAVIAC